MLKGAKLEVTEICVPSQLRNLMRDCWMDAPQDRPNFKTITDLIESFLSSSDEEHSEGFDDESSDEQRDAYADTPLLESPNIHGDNNNAYAGRDNRIEDNNDAYGGDSLRRNGAANRPTSNHTTPKIKTPHRTPRQRSPRLTSPIQDYDPNG